MTDYLRLAQERAPQSLEPQDNPYLPLAQQAQALGQNRARTVIETALRDDPDIAAERQRLSRTSGVPLNVVERNLEELRIKERARAVDLVTLAQESPVLYRQIADPTFTTTSIDDLDTLKNIERTIGSATAYAMGAKPDGGLATDAVGLAKDVGLGATVGVGRMMFNLAGTVNDLIGWKSGAEAARAQANRAQESMNFFGSQGQSSTAQAVRSGAQSAGQNLALLPLGLSRQLFATANQAAAAVAGAMSAGVGADAYLTAREKGRTQVQALGYAIPEAAFEYVFERIPASKLFGDIAANTGLLKTIGKQTVSEGWTEQVTTLAQDFNEWMNLNPDKTIGQFIQERPEAAYQTFIATLVGVGVQTSTIKGINKVIEQASNQALSFEQDRLQQQMALASQSLLRQRSPEQFRAHVEQVVEANPDTPQQIYVDAEVLNQLPQEVFAQLPETVRAQIPEALDTNSTVAISMADVLTVAPGTELEQVLNDNARMRPNASSRLEAQLAAEMIQQEADRVLAQAADQTAWQQSTQAVQQTILDQLTATGRFSADVNQAYATLQSAFFSTMAARSGTTPEQFYQDWSLKVAGSQQAGQVLNAPGGMALRTVNAGDTVDGRVVREGVANMESIAATLDNYEVLPGVREVPMSAFDPDYVGSISMERLDERTRRLAEEIRQSGEISPLIVVQDAEGMYVLEGGHRFDALIASGAKSLPAVVVTDLDSPPAQAFEQRGVQAKGKAIPGSIDAVSNVEASFEFAGSQQFPNNRDFKLAIQARVLEAAKAVKVKLDEFTQGVEQYLVRIAVADGQTALRTNANAVGWYNEKVTKALRLVSLIHPEIATDPQAKFAFVWAMAVTSNGLKVDKNFELAEKVYQGYTATGQMPTNVGIGTAAEAINRSLGLYNDLIAKHGFDVVEKFMTTLQPAGEVEKFTGNKVSGENKTTMVYGAAALGPKIGNGFFMNLYGRFEQLTMDRWLMRTWGRWTATLVESNPAQVKAKRTQLKALVQSLTPADKKAFEAIIKRKLTVGDIDAVGQAIWKASQKPANRKAMAAIGVVDEAGQATLTEILGEPKKDQVRVSLGDELRKGGNALTKYLDGQKEAPAGPPERGNIRKVFQQALAELQAQHPALTMSDFQALLWYPEKRLYDAAKTADEAADAYEDDEAPDYANAAAKLARAQGVSDADISSTLAAVDAELRAAVGAAGARPGERGPGAGAGDSGQQVLEQGPRGVLNQNPADYQGTHKPPGPDSASLADLTGNGVYPDDVYGPNGARYYGDGSARDAEAFRKAVAMRGKPKRGVTIYRAVPKGAPNTINAGDWVTLTRDYAVDHGEGALDGDYKIISKVVNAGNIYTNGDSIQEWGYWPDEGAYAQDERAPAKAPQPRGTFNPQALLISLNENADLSTFLHESGHFFLEVMADLASRDNAPQQIKDDMAATLKWFGVPDLATWNGYTLDQKRQYHERWAESFEQYLFEGKAPNIELQPLFRRFRSFMVAVYKSLTQFMRGRDLKVSDEIRAVFDRMIATDEQIAQAEEAAGMLPDFEATNEAIETLQARSLRDLKWTINARSKYIKKLTKEAKDLRKAVEAEVRAEVEQKPEVKAKRALDELQVTRPEDRKALKDWNAQRKAALDAARETIKAELLAANPEATGLKKGQLLAKNKRDIENRAEAKALEWEQANPRPVLQKVDNDLDIAVIADAYNFGSVDEMLQAIDSFGKVEDAIEGMTDQRMIERHGDLATPEAIEAAANEAVHNEARARSLATELKSQSEMMNPRQDTGQVNARGARITVNAITQAAKEFALNLAARRRIKDLKNAAWQHRAAEARAGKRWQQLTAEGKTQEAVQAKRDQLLNNYAAKALQDAQAEVKKTLEFFKRVVTGNDEKIVERGRDPDVVNAMRAILGAYDIAPRLEKSALAYMETVSKNDPATYAALQPSVTAALVNAKPFSELTLEELRGLTEELRAMWALAKRSRQMEVDGDLIDIQDAADELMARMDAIGIPDQVPGEKGAITDREEAGIKLQFAKSILRRVEQWAEGLDGKFGGPFLRLVFQPIKDAADRYRTAKVEYRQKFTNLVKGIAPLLPPGPVAAPEIGYTFGNARDSGMAELLHAILHTGNDSNKRKLLLGRGWASENADGTLDTSRWDAFIQRLITEGKLRKEHYDFAQGVWDLLEQTKPLAQETHRKVFGRYFAEVTANEVVTPFGTYRGGYVPAQTDSRLVKDAKLRELAEAENESMAYAFPASPSGFTKSRVEYNKPLLLDLRTLGQHLDKVLLFSHMQGAVTDVRRLLTRKDVSYALDRIDPGAYEGMLIPWLNRAAKQVVETPVVGDRKLSRFLSGARSRAGMALMFANLSNTVQQITGFSLAAVKVKPALMMKATGQFIADPKAMKTSVAEASPYMKDRMLNEVGAMNDAVEQILIDPSLLEKSQAWTQRHAYFLQAAVDNTMSPIIWTAAYNQAVEEGQEHKDAVRFADGVVRQTQGSLLPEDISRFESGPGYARLFTQFVSYFNMMANTNGTAVKQIVDEMGLKKGAGKLLYVALAGLLVPIWVAEAIAQAFRGGPDDEDKDGWLDDWLMAVFGMGTLRGLVAQVPILGQAAQLVVNRFNDNPADDKFSLSPAVSLIESAASSPASVYKAIVDDGNKQKAVRDVAAAATLLTGLPIYGAARPLGYLAGVADDRIEPTGPIDFARGLVTGTASPESKVP